MPQEPNTALFNLIPQPPIPDLDDGLEEIFEMIAAGLYSLASMLVGEGEESVRLVEEAVANAEVSVCQDPEVARQSSRRELCAAALELLAQRDPESLAAPAGLTPASVCIEEDDSGRGGHLQRRAGRHDRRAGARPGAGVAGEPAHVDARGFCAARGGRLQRRGDGRAAEGRTADRKPPHGLRKRPARSFARDFARWPRNCFRLRPRADLQPSYGNRN